jgi:BolA protein
VSAAPEERRARIEALLRERLAAVHVAVADESAQHAGHAGAASGGGHFRAVIVSAAFEGKGLVERQRLVYGALAEMLPGEIHALAMQTLTPGQWRGRGGADRAR